MADIRSDIRFGGTNQDLVWKSPITDFNSGSTVVVSESQGAVFYMNGEASEELGAGQHVLETCNIPFLRRIFNKGSRTPFQAELYYVNKVEIPNFRWGVGDITYREEGFVFPIGARGTYHVVVENARRLIEKINGTQQSLRQSDLEDRFFELVTSAVSNTLINAIYEKAGSIVEAPRYRTQIMQAVHPQVDALFREYGMRITRFVIDHIHVDDENPNYRKLLDLQQLQGGGAKVRLLEAQLQAQERGLQGQGEAAFRNAQGYTYQQEMQFGVLKTAAANDGAAGGLAGSMMQMGVGLGAAGVMGGMVKDNLTPMAAGMGAALSAAPAAACANCGAGLPEGSRFCLECGTPVAAANTVTCPHCGQTVPKGKFCLQCGQSLVTKKTCPSCGATYESGKFCLQCGTALN